MQYEVVSLEQVRHRFHFRVEADSKEQAEEKVISSDDLNPYKDESVEAYVLEVTAEEVE